MQPPMTPQQQNRIAAKAERRQSFEAHPFGRGLRHEEPLRLYDDRRMDAPSALVAFPGSMGKMAGIPACDLFEQVEDLAVRRIFVRGLADPSPTPHPLGGSLEEIAAGLEARLAPHSRVVFAGASLGGFFALLFATLLGADACIGFGATTWLDPAFLAAIQDDRFAAGALPGARDQFQRFADPVQMWTRDAAPMTSLHYCYRNETARAQAERLADWPNVVLQPHYERTFVASMRTNGRLRRELATALMEESPRSLS